MLSIGVTAQQIEKNRSALIYYMPKTEVMVDVEYERCDEQVGQFYQYSQRYLGTENVVKENKVSYKIKTISFITRTVADKDRSFTLAAAKNNVGISLTAEGILCGINTPCQCEVQNKFQLCAETGSTDTKPHIIPLGEEQMLSGSVAKMAESTAKQIYHIRESRLNILSGEVDNMPTESEAVRLILEQLREQEDALCSLFTGNRDITSHHAYYKVNLSEDTDNILFRFSTLQGPVEADNLSGAPVNIKIELHKMEYAQTPKANKELANAIYYNIPGTADITIYQGKQTLAQTDMAIPQLGITVPLEAQWQNKKIIINPSTGMVSQVEQ